MIKKIASIIVLLLFFVGCSPEDFGEVDLSPGNHPTSSNGLYVLNEGLFGHGDGEITYVNESSGEVVKNFFFLQNNYSPGDIVFDAVVLSDQILLSVNNSNLVYLLNKQWQVIKKINITQPRWLLPAYDKVYISSLSRPYIYIFDLKTNSLRDSIPVHRPLEQLLWVNGKIWGIHWSNIASQLPNRYVMVIDTLLLKPIDSITVGKEPNSLVLDKEGKVWILCGGGYNQDEAPSLWKIDPLLMQIQQQFSFVQGQDYPSSLTINLSGDTLFFINKHVYSMPINANALPSSSIYTTTSDVYYSLSYDTLYRSLWICNARDYLHEGEIIEITSSGQKIKTFPTGKIPRKVLRLN